MLFFVVAGCWLLLPFPACLDVRYCFFSVCCVLTDCDERVSLFGCDSDMR